MSNVFISFGLAIELFMAVITLQPFFELVKESINAQIMPDAKRKLTAVLHSKSILDPSFQVGHPAKVYFKQDKEKRKIWLISITRVGANFVFDSVTIPFSTARTMTAAFGDIRTDLEGESFTLMTQGSSNILDRDFSDKFDAKNTTID